MLAWLEIEYQIMQKVYAIQLEAQKWNKNENKKNDKLFHWFWEDCGSSGAYQTKVNIV